MSMQAQLGSKMAGRLAAAVLAAALAGSADVAVQAADWPQWRGPGRDGISAETGWQATWPEGGPKILWRKNVGAGYSAVSVAGGRVYTLGNVEGYVKTTDTIWCLDAATGAEVWKYAYPSKAGSYPGPRSSPTVDGDFIFTVSRHGDLLCLNAKDGTPVWQVNLRQAAGVKDEPHEWGLSCSPLVSGNLVLLDLGKVVAVDKASGKVAFTMGEEGPGFSSPVVFERNGKRYVTSFNQFGLILYDLESRKEAARHEWKTKFQANTATPVVSGDRIFVTSGYGRGCALLEFSGTGLKVVYENTNLASECIAAVLYKGYLYGVTGEQSKAGALRCLDFATGQLKWEKSGIRVGGGLTIADGKILHMADGGMLSVAEATPDAYRELGAARVLTGYTWTMPVLANGRIYCRNAKGDLACLDVAAK